MTFIAAHPYLVAGTVAVVAASFTRPGRWTWRHWWWPLACWWGRRTFRHPDRYTRPGRLDPQRWYSDAQKEKAVKRDPRCACPGGCGADTHHYRGRCEVIHLEGQKLVGGHRVAHARGGRTTPENLVMLCAACNGAWSDREVPRLPRRVWYGRFTRRTSTGASTERVWG